MLHGFFLWCLGCVDSYAGIVLLMALESSIVPVPSELVMPPAAYWAAQGKLDFWLVVLAGTVGSYIGSAVSYWVAQWVGRPLIDRYGKYLLMPQSKVALAERWARDNGMLGIFVSRMLPVVRHLISIPAGILRMRFSVFSLVTIAGAGIWCFVLTWWGGKVLGDAGDELLKDPEKLMGLVKSKMWWFVGAVVVIGVLFFVALRKRKAPAPATPA